MGPVEMVLYTSPIIVTMQLPLVYSCRSIRFRGYWCTSKILRHHVRLSKIQFPDTFGHFLTGGGREGGYATFVWQECAHTRTTHMTRVPSLKPQSLLCYKQGS